MIENHKLLVGRTRHLALRAAKAFGIDPREWLIEGMGFALGGRRFDKIIVLPIVDDIPPSRTERENRNRWVAHLFTKMAFGKEDQLFILD